MLVKQANELCKLSIFSAHKYPAVSTDNACDSRVFSGGAVEAGHTIS